MFYSEGTKIEIRPIQPDDEGRMVRFHQGLSERSVYMRYFETLSLSTRTAHPRLSRICFVDPEHEIVLVALSSDEVVGVGRLSKTGNANKAELAVIVTDKFQGRGIGKDLIRGLFERAREQGIMQIEAEILRDNTQMQRVLKTCGFRLQLVDARTVRALCNL